MIGVTAALGLLVVACGEDDGAAVREIGADSGSASGSGSGSGSGSASGSASGSGSASASGSGSGSGSASAPSSESGATAGDGGYQYASNVDSHRLVVADICEIGEYLDAGDFDSASAVYRDGRNSVKSDGSIRSIGGFASRDDRAHGLDAFYGAPAPIDAFVTAALEGSGIFEGEADAVRAQGVEKGIQNQAMVAWVVHEFNTAVGKAEAGDFDVASGAVHNWDEGWAFFHGAEPGCAPYATGDKRAANFGTTEADGETARANRAILAAMIEGRDALLSSDAAGASAAAAEVMRNLVVTYSQAAIRYASLIEGDLADGDAAKAREHQAEGLAFWRVIEAYAVPAGADGAAVNAVLGLANQPGANGFGAEVRAALRPAFDAMGISAADIGELR